MTQFLESYWENSPGVTPGVVSDTPAVGVESEPPLPGVVPVMSAGVDPVNSGVVSEPPLPGVVPVTSEVPDPGVVADTSVVASEPPLPGVDSDSVYVGSVVVDL